MPIDNLHPNIKRECIHDCKEVTQGDQFSTTWKFCLEPNYPQKSVYKHCEKKMKTSFEIVKCKVDFCNLCCSISNDIFAENFSDVAIKDCHYKCWEKFLIQE